MEGPNKKNGSVENIGSPEQSVAKMFEAISQTAIDRVNENPNFYNLSERI